MKLKKFLASGLACVVALMMCIVPVRAVDEPVEVTSDGERTVPVNFTQESSYTVKLPAQIQLVTNTSDLNIITGSDKILVKGIIGNNEAVKLSLTGASNDLVTEMSSHFDSSILNHIQIGKENKVSKFTLTGADSIDVYASMTTPSLGSVYNYYTPTGLLNCSDDTVSAITLQQDYSEDTYFSQVNIYGKLPTVAGNYSGNVNIAFEKIADVRTLSSSDL